jgi:hypothetical protein
VKPEEFVTIIDMEAKVVVAGPTEAEFDGAEKIPAICRTKESWLAVMLTLLPVTFVADEGFVLLRDEAAAIGSRDGTLVVKSISILLSSVLTGMEGAILDPSKTGFSPFSFETKVTVGEEDEYISDAKLSPTEREVVNRLNRRWFICNGGGDVGWWLVGYVDIIVGVVALDVILWVLLFIVEALLIGVETTDVGPLPNEELESAARQLRLMVIGVDELANNGCLWKELVEGENHCALCDWGDCTGGKLTCIVGGDPSCCSIMLCGDANPELILELAFITVVSFRNLINFAILYFTLFSLRERVQLRTVLYW